MKETKSPDYKLMTKQMAVKPFVYTRPSVSSISIRFIVLLAVQVLMLLFTKSYKSLFVVSVSFIGALAAAALDYLINKSEPYKFMNIIIQGLLIGLLLPENYPVVSVFFISFVTLFVSKCFIFRKVNTWVNISAFAVVIAWFIGQKFFPSFEVTSDIIGLKNSSVYLVQGSQFPLYSFDSSITGFLNNHILNLFNASIPEGFISMMWDNHSIIPAFRFNIITILSSIFIFSDNAFSGIIPSVFLLFYSILVRFFSSFIFGGVINQGDILLALFSSGTLFTAVFLVQWFGSVPVTTWGKIVQGLVLGAVAFAIVGCGTSPIGMVYTVLIGNISSVMIRVFEEKKNSYSIGKSFSKKIVKGEI